MFYEALGYERVRMFFKTKLWNRLKRHFHTYVDNNSYNSYTLQVLTTSTIPLTHQQTKISPPDEEQSRERCQNRKEKVLLIINNTSSCIGVLQISTPRRIFFKSVFIIWMKGRTGNFLWDSGFFFLWRKSAIFGDLQPLIASSLTLGPHLLYLCEMVITKKDESRILLRL